MVYLIQVSIYVSFPHTPLSSSFLYFLCFTQFQTETSRNSARLTCHFSYLFLVLLVLILFGSLRFILFQNQKKKLKLKFYKKNYYPILSKSPLPSFPFPRPPFLFPSGHPEPPHSPNPPEPWSLLDHRRPDPTRTP